MKNIAKFITLVFIIIILSSVSLFAQWEISIDSDLMFITKFDKQNGSALRICVDTLSVNDRAYVYDNKLVAMTSFYNDKILPENDLYLRIKKKSNNYIKYSVSDEDIIESDEYMEDTIRFGESIFICIGASNGIRANNFIKILLDSSLVELYSNDELLCSYELEGLKEVLEENLGNTEWYNQKIKN